MDLVDPPRFADYDAHLHKRKFNDLPFVFFRLRQGLIHNLLKRLAIQQFFQITLQRYFPLSGQLPKTYQDIFGQGQVKRHTLFAFVPVQHCTYRARETTDLPFVAVVAADWTVA